MKIYITGILGMLSEDIIKAFYNDVNKIYGCDIKKSKYSQIDITDYDKLEADILKIKSDVIIHTACLIDTERCQKDQDFAYKVNVNGTKNIVEIVKTNKLKCKIVYISTHAIYEGIVGNYKEDEVNDNQVNYYSRTKYLAEKEIEKYSNHLILRVNIFGFGKADKSNNYAEYVMDCLISGKEFNAYDDIYFNPLYTSIFANCLPFILDKTGIYNIGARNSMSKFDFALKLAEMFGYNQSLVKKTQSNFNVNRPKNITTNCEKIGLCLPTIESNIVEFKSDWLKYRR